MAIGTALVGQLRLSQRGCFVDAEVGAQIGAGLTACQEVLRQLGGAGLLVGQQPAQAGYGMRVKIAHAVCFVWGTRRSVGDSNP